MGLKSWELLTKREFDKIDREQAVVFVSCSPIEVHGPHLPLGSDVLESEGLVERTCRFLPERHRSRDLLRLPKLYTACDVLPQGGSLHFPPETVVQVVSDLGMTLADQGFKNIAVASFHGGPRHFLAIEKGCHQVTKNKSVRMASIFSLLVGRLTSGVSELGDLLGDLPGVDPDTLEGDTHAGFVETSNMLVLHGDRVDLDYKDLPRQTVKTWLEDNRKGGDHQDRDNPYGFLSTFSHFRAAARYFRQQTYSGDPGEGSAEHGERILDILGQKSAEVITELLDGELRPEQFHSPLWKWHHLVLNPALGRLIDLLVGAKYPTAQS